MKPHLIALSLLSWLSLQPLEAKREAWHAEQAQAMYGGELEVRLKDGTRVDLLTETHAYEVEHSSNWKEAIGQALHYALLTDRKAGIILVMEKPKADAHLQSLKAVIEAYELPVEVVELCPDR